MVKLFLYLNKCGHIQCKKTHKNLEPKFHMISTLEVEQEKHEDMPMDLNCTRGDSGHRISPDCDSKSLLEHFNWDGLLRWLLGCWQDFISQHKCVKLVCFMFSIISVCTWYFLTKHFKKKERKKGKSASGLLTILIDTEGRGGGGCTPISPVGLSRSKEHSDISVPGKMAQV